MRCDDGGNTGILDMGARWNGGALSQSLSPSPLSSLSSHFATARVPEDDELSKRLKDQCVCYHCFREADPDRPCSNKDKDYKNPDTEKFGMFQNHRDRTTYTPSTEISNMHIVLGRVMV